VAKDSGRYEYMARAMSAMTTDIFYKYSPIKDYDYCNADAIIKKASVVFSGYDKGDYLRYQKVSCIQSNSRV